VPGTPASAYAWSEYHNPTPYSEQWSFGVQRQLAHDLMLEVDYVGNGGRHMSFLINRNDPQPGPGVVGQPGHFRPYQYADPLGGTYPSSPGLGAVSGTEDYATSDYNGLQVKLEKRFSNGLQFLGSYAWSHYLDIGGCGLTQSYSNPVSQPTIPQIDNDPTADRADGCFDFRHIFTGNWVYDLPVGHGRSFMRNSGKFVDALLGGWEFTGIYHANTGSPLTVNINFDNANIGQSMLSARPDYVSGQPQRTTPPPGTDITTGYLNPNAYVVAPQYTYGNLGRGTVRNLGMQNFDLGLYKSFPIRENRESFQFRAEFFNAFNHTNLGMIDGTLEDATFGSIGSTQNSARQIQFALKFYY
jgi:hypothetical protein